MGNLFDPPDVPDNSAAQGQLASAQATQQAKIDARDAELTQAEEARKRALAGAQRGRVSLLGPAGEVGVTEQAPLKQTLGG